MACLYPFAASRQVIYTRSMVTSKRPSAAIIAAGIVAIVGSVLTMLGVLMGLFGVILGPHLAQQSPMPTFVQTTAIAGMAFLLAQTALGIFTGVGLLRLRNWARISALVWAGITVPCALLIVFMMLLVPLPTPSRPEARPPTSCSFSASFLRSSMEFRSAWEFGG